MATTTRRVVKTIVLHPNGTGFFISASKWRDPMYALTNPVVCNHAYGTICNCKALGSLSDWRWIGSPGWFGTEGNKAIYEAIEAAGVIMTGWHDGEYTDVDLELEVADDAEL